MKLELTIMEINIKSNKQTNANTTFALMIVGTK